MVLRSNSTVSSWEYVVITSELKVISSDLTVS